MRSTRWLVALGIVAVLAVAALAYAVAQPGAQDAAWMDPMAMQMAGWPPAPQPIVTLGDDVVYVACDGVLIAYEARTLKPLGEAIYWERPETVQ